MSVTDCALLKAIVCGRVQGVCFRAFVTGWAINLDLTGYVHNLPDGNVEVQAEGARKQLIEFARQLEKGPPDARVEKVMTLWSAYTGNYADFRVRY